MERARRRRAGSRARQPGQAAGPGSRARPGQAGPGWARLGQAGRVGVDPLDRIGAIS